VIQDADVAQAALDRFKAAQKVQFSDCLMLEIARKTGHAPLGAFDKEFAKARLRAN
jgi:predicted nucleic-acid-binding protein